MSSLDSQRKDRILCNIMSETLVTSSSFQTSYERDTLLCTHTGSSGEASSFVNIEPSLFENMPSHLEVSVSAVLCYCKKKVLDPLFRLLAMLGWRPLCYNSQHEGSLFFRILGALYLLFVIALILSGYLLPYSACFRRDGFPPYQDKTVMDDFKINHPNWTRPFRLRCNATVPSNVHCSGGVFSVYVFPDLVHLLAFICTLYLMRLAEHEHLATLMERVFIQMSLFQTWFLSQRKMIRTLRWLLYLGVFWVVVSIASQVLQVLDPDLIITFRWLQPNSSAGHLGLMFLMLFTITWNDIICIVIATSYSVHCQLIIAHLNNLRRSIIERTANFQSFFKELQESRKFVNFLNNEQAVGISLLALSFGCRATTGIYGLVTKTSDPYRTPYTTASLALTVFLWIGLLLYPCIQAVYLTEACANVRKLGHVVRARPFGYQDTSQEDLDSFLLFTSTLTMRARIFRIPVQASCLFLALVCIVFTMVLLGQLGLMRVEYT